MNYCQSKTNEAADALSRFFQRSQSEKNKLKIENTQILHKLQSVLTNASFSGLGISAKLLPIDQVLICKTYVLLQLCQFWNDLQTGLVEEVPYKASISGIRLRLAELQESNEEARKIRATKELQKG